MNTHEKINELLVHFVLGELTEQQSSEVTTHLADCKRCSNELKRLEALVECTEQIRELSADKQMCESAKQMIFATIGGEETKQSALRQNVRLAFIWRTITKSPITRLAAAAVIILAISLFIVYLGPSEQVGAPKVLEVSKSPAEMMTAISLTMAYRRGGIEAVEQQCEKAIEMLGPRPATMTVKELLRGSNG